MVREVHVYSHIQAYTWAGTYLPWPDVPRPMITLLLGVWDPAVSCRVSCEDRASPVIGVQKYLLNDRLMKETYSVPNWALPNGRRL